MTLPPEIGRIIGLRVHPGLWNVRTQAGILQLRNKPNRSEREEKRLINLLSYAQAVLAAARRGERAPLRWIRQPTGRWSTKKPNLHSISKSFGLRDAVIPADGKVFVRADWSGAHLTIAGGLSEDPRLLDDIGDGGVYEGAMRVIAPELGDAGRPITKIVCLTTLNGGGSPLLRAYLADVGLVLPVDEVSRRRAEWIARYPGLGRLMADVRKTRSWSTPFGNRIALPEGAPNHKALGWAWQSFESDALLGVLRALYRDHPEWPVAFCFYDEILLETPLSEAEAAEAYLLDLMGRAIRWASKLPDVAASALCKVKSRPTWSGIVPDVWPADGAVLRPIAPLRPVLRPLSR